MPTIVAGIDIDRAYTGDEVLEMHRKGRLRDITLEGYCTRADADGTIKFVPYYESTWFRLDADKPVQSGTNLAERMLADVEANHPIHRRTPQERVASMMLRLMAEYKRSGTLPGVPADLIERVTGSAWREGEPLTAEDIRAVAAHYMGVGEKENRESDRKRVARHHATA